MKLFLICLAALVHNARSQCSVNVPTKTPKTLAPVYLTSSKKLWPMDSAGNLNWKKGEKTMVLCSGPDNVLSLTNKQISTMECVSGTKFKTETGKEEDILKWTCTKEVWGDLRDTQKSCGDGGTLYELGFSSGTTKDFIRFIDVCYNKKTGSPQYTQHTLYGTAIFSKCDTQTRRDFDMMGTIPEVKTLKAEYTQKDQVARYTKQSKEIAKRVGANMLEKGHLTPYCDALFQSWKHATQFYVNTAPEWKRLNGANWKRVETLARDQAVAMKTELEIYTGTYGILEVDKVKMKFLANGYVDVPKYFWKVIKNPKDNKGIAFVSYNNLNDEGHEELCKDICKETKWNSRHPGKDGLSDTARGRTYCCDVNELMGKIKLIPKTAATKGLLEFAAAAPGA